MGDMADYYMEHDLEREEARPSRRKTMQNEQQGLNLAEEIAAGTLQPHPVYRGLMLKESPASVVGLPFPNPDGSSRQAVAHALQIGDLVKMLREPTNPFDANAVMVFRLRGDWPADVNCETSDQVGYLPKGLAEIYAPLMDEGLEVFGVVESKNEKAPGVYSFLKVRTGVVDDAAWNDNAIDAQVSALRAVL